MNHSSIKRLTLLLLLITGGGGFYTRAQCALMDPSETPTGNDVLDESSVPFDALVRRLVGQLNQFYGLSCEYRYYDDSAAHNARADQQDGNLYLGINFMTEIAQGRNSLPGMCYVIAHEMGHAYQFRHPQRSLLSRDRYGELQADFLAGYALARLGYVGLGTYRQVLQQAWAIGDPDGRWQDPDAHGSSGERAADTAAGMQRQGEPLSSVYAWAYYNLPPSRTVPPRTKVRLRVMVANGQQFNVLYGGEIVDQAGEHAGQMSSYPGTNYWLFNFSKAGDTDLIGDPSTGLVYWIGQPNQAVGRFQVVARD